MTELRKTPELARWFDDMRGLRARARTLVRIQRLADGHPGDVKPVGEGVSELRIDYGPDPARITRSGAAPGFCCCAAVTSARRTATSNRALRMARELDV
jgi:putative component of toxin-antitoxin plasmid stabilization module